MNITNDIITAYLDSLYRSENEDLGRLREYGEDNMYHIILKDTEDLLRVIDGELMELPDNQRAAFAMSRYDGKTYDEISSSLGISRKTVQYHISRVLERLRHLLK